MNPANKPVHGPGTKTPGLLFAFEIQRLSNLKADTSQKS
jgi:hypothetical protein